MKKLTNFKTGLQALIICLFLAFSCGNPNVKPSKESKAEGKESANTQAFYTDGINSFPQKSIPKGVGELLNNPNFNLMYYWNMDLSELGSQWSYQNIVYDTTAKAVLSPGYPQTKTLSQPVSLDIGFNYNLSVNLGIENTFNTGLNSVVLRVHYDGTFQDFPINTFVPSFQKVELNFTATKTQNEVGIQVISFANSGVVYVDYVSLKEN